MERYLLQPVKSVVMHYKANRRSPRDLESCWTIYDQQMPLVEETSHMGILRSSTSDDVPVNENIKKARRALYSLMPSGLHGNNGLDPETCLQLYQTYIIPVLLNGLEVILPKRKLLDNLERVNKKFLKQILSLPTTTADTAVYVISGTIPIEGTIHKKVLSLYGNICRLDKSSVEYRLADRQLSISIYCLTPARAF